MTSKSFTSCLPQFSGCKRHLSAIAICAFALMLVLNAEPAQAALGGGLDSITSKIDEINTWLIGLGSFFAVTGFIWAILALIGRMGGLSNAVSVLFAGLAVGNAKEIVGFFIR